MSCPDSIRQLIAKFSEQSDQYRSADYNETQVRVDFINPMFKALGWDMDNIAGYAEPYRDVVHEDAIRIEGNTKAPDYSFRIGGVRKFFLEAKRPSVNIKDSVEPAYQLRRYAWTAKLPLSILTDFEEFAIYDTRKQPKHLDRASNARISYFTYDEYPERWDEIAGIFSKDAILKGAFDRFVESKGKSGTSEFDDEFLKEIEEWRKKLAQNLALRNDSLSESDLNFAVQRIIDRIIFLRICEARGTERFGQLQALLAGEETYARFLTLFRAADDRYNSGLFHFSAERGRHEQPDELTPNLDIDDQTLKSIIRRLYYPESPYAFSAVAPDILGNIYERFLGSTIELTPAHRAKVELKPEVRKAGGVYYTPTYIVDYIVKNTVGKLTRGKTPKEAAKLKIIDPACGSGSFLLGAYQYLLDWHLEWYVKDGAEKWLKGKDAKLRQGPAGQPLLTSKIRKQILVDNIFGVDIDYQAVEVTKLSLLLKVLEGETTESVDALSRLFHERALPDLGDNIKWGNSLVGPDIYETDAGITLTPDEKKRIKSFDWREEFKGVFAQGGFDAVIANPPYINMLTLDKLQPPAIKPYWKSKYRSASGAYDIYVLFFEQAFKILRQRGLFAFIVPNKFLAAEYAIEFRDWISQAAKFRSLVDFSRVKVWTVGVYPVVPIFEKAMPVSDNTIEIFTASKRSADELQNTAELRQSQLRAMPDFLWSFITKEGVAVLSRLMEETTPLEAVAEIYGATTVAEGSEYPELLVSDRRSDSRDQVARFVVSGSIHRYATSWSNEPIQFAHGKYKRPLIRLSAPMPMRRIEQATQSKIIISKVALEPRAFLDKNGEYVGAYTTYIFAREVELTYLIGVINSRLMRFIYRLLYDALAMAGGYLRFQPPQVRRLPIRISDSGTAAGKRLRNRLSSLVNSMIALQNSQHTTKTPHEKESLRREIEATDRRIDNLVYELYDLTDQEIHLVEAQTA